MQEQKNSQQYGLFTYPSPGGYFNIGDYVQSIAARQYLGNKNVKLINRDQLDTYNGGRLKIIMNGWFTHFPENWPPSEEIEPLFISFHLNKTMEQRFFNTETISYLKKFEPIGCRDLSTKEILQQHGISGYYSGCLTLTLGQTYRNKGYNKNSEILFVDPVFNLPSWENTLRSPKSFIKNGILKKYVIKGNKKNRIFKEAVGEDIAQKGILIKNIIRNKYDEKEKFELAENYLERLSKAKLVITSRIHCALPCIAMGTPVVFIDSFNEIMDLSRFKGITNLFPTIKLAELLKIPREDKSEFLKRFSKSVLLDQQKVKKLELQAINFIKE